MLASFARIRRAARRSPLEATLALAAIGVGLYVLAAPLAASRYPPMTDLPFHAAQAATFRHYWDPAYHFREQFELHPLQSPYMGMYALGAALMLIFPPLLAVKITLAALLGLVPAGLAVMFHGMKKSPLLGLMGLGICWGNLTHWGFTNYVGALGLFAMTVGLTLLVLDRPTRRRRVALGLCLVALFFMHIFRFPFGIAAVVGTALVMFPVTRRLRPILLPMLPSLALFALWWKLRPAALDGTLGPLSFHLDRLPREFMGAIVEGFTTKVAARALLVDFDVAYAVAVVCLLASALRALRGRRVTGWDVGVTVVPLACAAVFLALFLVLPMRLGLWWYVYPREAVAATLVLFGACPDLPRARWLRVPLVLALGLGGLGAARAVAREYATFQPQTDDFDRITARLPQAPRLFYMVFDHGGTSRSTSPFMHLPAWVQAQKGGWLSWHFAVWNALPVTFRPRGQPGFTVTPMTPPRWEWTPEQIRSPATFDALTPFYDWFLVRKRDAPDDLFQRDPAIQRVDHQGLWWLYKRAGRG